MRKNIGIFLVCMMLVTSAIFVFQMEQVKATGNTLYVGGIGSGNYTTIQSAIDAANAGDTVFVYSGSYLEQYYYGCDLYINKPINVVGENKETTFIYGGYLYPYNCIAIENNGGVEFSGFTINNSFLEFCQCCNSIVHDVILNMDAAYDSRCIYIQSNSNNNVFYDNIFNNAEQSVRIWSDGSTNNLFYHNNFLNNTYPPYDYSSGNYFYNATLQEGNYYDDYTGIDDIDYPGHYHCDGMGDTPYSILGGSNQDLYPLMYPWYPEHPDNIYVNKEYNVSTPGFGYDMFNRIQYGINEISDNGTIDVFNDYYTEDLDMWYKTNVSLIGESMDNVILNRKNWNAFILVGCTDVTIKNFNFSGLYFVINDHNTRVKASNLYLNPNGDILGIEVFHSNQDCEIHNCHVTNSTYGISVEWPQGNPDDKNTYIHHNNMFDNINNARDNGDRSSIWEYNYYDDYTGEDNNNDGIGDTPYDIGGSAGNQDLYPLMSPFDPSLIACWHFDEGTGNIAHDSSGNNYDAMIYGASWSSGISGFGLSFDGQDDYIEVPLIDGITNIPLNEITFECWINLGGITGIPQQIIEGHTIEHEINIERLAESSIIQFDIVDDYGVLHHITTSSLAQECWYHLVATVNGTTQCIYVNGELNNVSSWTNPFTITTGFMIGKDYEGAGQYLNGKLDEFRIYSRGLNQEEILVHYQQYSNKQPTANFTYTPENPTNTSVVHFSDTSYDPDGTIDYWWWDFDDGYYSDLQNPIHCYYTDGVYNVRLIVIDNDGSANFIQKTIIVYTPNNPPSRPSTPIGPTKGIINVMHIFTTDAIDLDGNLIYYKWNWGDGTISEWLGPYGSGLLAGASHAWANKGTYYICVKTMDIFGAESDWSEPLAIKILKP